MLAITLMPTALKYSPWHGSGWRAVEAQHANATMALVSGDTADQALLESLLDEEGKPDLPREAHGLHWLLSTPFRYKAPPPQGSRFCAKSESSVFYGAEDVRTACAEVGYWRMRFWMDSQGLKLQSTAMPMTLFEFHGASDRLLDLTADPYHQQKQKWTHPTDYRHTQTIASQARSEDIQVIRSVSVRNLPDGRCITILTPDVFKAVNKPFRHKMQTWNLYIAPPNRAVWTRELSDELVEFAY